MNYCSYCGVELDNDMNRCPLCGLAVGKKNVVSLETRLKQSLSKDKMANEIEKLSVAQKRKLFWEISGIILLSGIIATLLINLIINKHISWAKYNLVISLSVFANISFFTLWRHKPYLLVFGSFISNAVLLYLLDLISSNIGWGLHLSLPILVSFYALFIIVLWLIRISNHRGFNILGIIFIAIALFLICTEASLSVYFKNTIQLSWSIIAGSSLIPISAVLFFVHYRFKKGAELRRFFHI